jgi:outer membrane protein assembly factor BamB
MNERQLGAVMVVLMASIAVGFLFVLFRSPPEVAPRKRLADVPAEQAAGTMGGGVVAASPGGEVERVDIEGEFLEFDGQPGKTTADWPHFRGADFSNICSDSVPLAESWGEGGPPLLWDKPIDLGEGHSGAVVWKGRVYVMDYDEEKQGDALRCFSIVDGREIWRRWYKAPTKRNHGVSRTVPALTDRYIVAIGPRCHVMCLDTETGAYQWGIDMVADHGAEVPLWYTGQCPLIDGETVVLAPAGRSLMIGVDIATGNVMWETPNPGGWKMTHASVMPMMLLGKKMYVYCASGGVAGVSAEKAAEGELLWQSTAWNNKVTSPSPLKVDDQQLFLTAGNGAGSLMLELKEAGGAITAKTVFEQDKKTGFSCEQQTPILYEKHIFGVLPKSAGERREQFACFNASGKIVWTSGKTARYGLGPFLMADNKFFILNDNGELSMIKASLNGFEPLAQARVLKGHDAWAPMALVDGKLLLRDSKQMICLDVRKSRIN